MRTEGIHHHVNHRPKLWESAMATPLSLSKQTCCILIAARETRHASLKTGFSVELLEFICIAKDMVEDIVSCDS